MLKIKWIDWIKLGAIAGAIWSIIAAILVNVFGSNLGGILIDAGPLTLSNVITGVFYGVVYALLGRVITEFIGFQSKESIWKIFQVLFTGELAVLLIAMLTRDIAITSIVTRVFGALIACFVQSWIIVELYKRVGWRLPVQ